jgi:S-adenosylmethionine/arginine decarboxylase-like enzyme
MIRTEQISIRIDCGDPAAVWLWFLTVVGKLSVTVLGTVKHEFPGGGLTGLVAIGESHAAIHTWPENGLIWCELATCGDPADCDRFRDMIRSAESRKSFVT